MNHNHRLLMTVFFIALSAILSGCNTNKQAEANNALSPEYQATQQAQEFFNQHPEYSTSKEKEALLFAEFQRLMKEPHYKNMTMYQLLIIAHDRIKR